MVYIPLRMRTAKRKPDQIKVKEMRTRSLNAVEKTAVIPGDKQQKIVRKSGNFSS